MASTWLFKSSRVLIGRPAKIQAVDLLFLEMLSRKFQSILFIFGYYMTLLDKYSNDIQMLCKSHRVKKLYAFGSVLTDQFSHTSDVDLIVDFDNIDVANYADNYFDFKFSLQNILKHPVDLLEEKAIKNPYFKKAISQKRQLVYGF